MRILDDRSGPSSHVRRHFRCAWCRSEMPAFSLASASEENYGMCSACLKDALGRVCPTRSRAQSERSSREEATNLLSSLTSP